MNTDNTMNFEAIVLVVAPTISLIFELLKYNSTFKRVLDTSKPHTVTALVFLVGSLATTIVYGLLTPTLSLSLQSFIQIMFLSTAANKGLWHIYKQNFPDIDLTDIGDK